MLLLPLLLGLATPNFLRYRHGPISVDVQLRSAEKCEKFGLWGASAGKDQVVGLIELKVGTRKFDVARSAYADLGNVRVVRADWLSDGLHLFLHGGENSTSYEVDILLRHGKTVSRAVVDGETHAAGFTTYRHRRGDPMR